MNKLLKSINIVIIIALLISILRPVDSNAATTNIAKIGDETYNSIYEAVQNAKDGDVIEILQDTTENNVININNGITINGNGHKIISDSLTGTQATFLLSTSEATVINDINIETNLRAIAINNSLHNFSINNSVLTAGQRGITVNTDDNQNSNLNINDCIIQKKRI